MSKKVVFLLGTLSDSARFKNGDALSRADFDLLSEVADLAGVDAEIVFCCTDVKAAGAGKKVSMKMIRDERQRVLDEVNAHKPDVVVGFGPVALKTVMNKGNVTLAEHQRSRYTVDGLNAPVYFTHSLELVAAKNGARKLLVLDTRAAVDGFVTTQWGDYDVILPGSDAWANCPECYADLAANQVVGFDLETYPGLDPWHPDARIRMAVISCAPHKAHVVQLGPDSRMPDWLVKIVEDPQIVKAGSNIKFDYKWLRRFGTGMVNMHDTSVAEHILDETLPMKDLKTLTFVYAPWLGDYSRDHRRLVVERGGWEHVADDEQYAYAGADGEASYVTAVKQRRLLMEKDLWRPFTLAMDVYGVLCDMEHNGCCIDMDINSDLDVLFMAEMAALRKQITTDLGPINPASHQQLADALVRVVPGISLTKRKIMRVFEERPGDEDDDEISTNRETLEREAHKHPIIETVLRWRRLNKLHGTYVVGVRDKYRVQRPDGKWYLSTTFRADVTETNRLSSQGPNLQNQPTKPDPDDPHPIPMELNTKLQFISRFPGGVFMEGDLSQAEIRLAAMISGDKKMLGAIESGQDVHTAMAATLLNKKFDDVTKHERHQCKRLTFLILYGGGANTLSGQLGVRKDEAKGLIADYFRTFNQLDFYINRQKMMVKRDLHLQSIFGYRRRFRKPGNWNTWDGWRIERQAWNFLVQNSAGCVLFVALIDLHRRMQELGLKSKLVLTVHDSIGADVHPDEIEIMAKLMKQCLEGPHTEQYGVTLTVPMEADIEVGPTWGDKKPHGKE